MNRKIKNSNGYILGSHRKLGLALEMALVVLAMVLGGAIVHAYHIVNGH